MYQYEKEHLKYVFNNAAECTVLLKTDGKFPLKKAGKLAAFGSGMRYTVKGGTGSGEVNSRFTFTIEEGLRRSGFEITTEKWLDAYDQVREEATKTFYKNLRREAKGKKENVIMYAMGKIVKEPEYDLTLEGEGDTAIFVVSRNSGEGSDREVVPGDVLLTKSEIRDILALNQQYERFMLVLNVGGVIDLTPVAEVGNILLLSQLGVNCGKVLADILTGKQNPSGKLSTTWAAWEDYNKEGSFGDWDETRYREGIYVGYRYFDTFGKKALFPFGYGLSYTTFSQEIVSVVTGSGQAAQCYDQTCEEKVNTDQINAADTIVVKVKVRNTGVHAGKEVVQMYISLPEGKLDKAYQELAGFEKTSLLAPGAEEEVTISCRLSDLASYDEETASYILEKGEYIVRIGNSSVSTRVAAVAVLDETVTTLKVKNCLGTPDFTDIKANTTADKTNENMPDDTCGIAGEELSENVIRLSLKAADLSVHEVIYDTEYEIDPRVKDLTDEELAFLQIGNFNPDAKGLSIIGNAGVHVAGAAGETTSYLADKGIAPLVMADGPAGLRLAKQYYEEKGLAYGVGGEGIIPESMLAVMSPVVKFLALKVTQAMTGAKKPSKNAQIKDHYATMIPIGTAVAQSFNTKLARVFGDIVGSEMEMMGVHLWLAPALNIHRSILCGRNFEYYSEDPLLSGLTAAAITEGVQAHKGCGTTIKHYAANNAETNRYGNDSQVSERAMREIYVRGFAICIRKAQPKSVMTSYNLLNGIHTAEHRGLIEDVLRSEFGFKGIVMTDWVLAMMSSKKSVHRNSLSHEVAKAGGDLFMPGGKKDYANVVKALKEGDLSRKQLEINATRVIRMVDQLTGK